LKPKSKVPSPVLHRAFLFALFAGSIATASAQPDKFTAPIDRAATGNADQAEGARILAEFRGVGLAGDSWLAFELRVMPRQGAERSFTGTLLGARGPVGPLLRLKVDHDQWLIESGPAASAWTLRSPASEAKAISAGESIAGTDVTVFDLQMPFLYWPDFTYEGQAKVRGRPTHSFILRAPSGDSPVKAVRVLIDTQFQALVQAEELGPNNAIEKTISLLDLKKVGEKWLVKTIDVRNHRTRDKTRLSFTAAALDLELPLSVFSPEGLTVAPPVVPPAKVVRF
jgi:hypothetical protein